MDLATYLSDIHFEMRQRGLPEMDDETLKEVAKHVQHPEVMRAMQSGQLTASKIVDEVQQAMQGIRQRRTGRPSGGR